MTIYKKDLARMVQDLSSYKLDRNLSIDVVDAVLNSIIHFVSRGDKVNLHEFGIFSTKNTEERVRRNPRTGEDVVVPEHLRICFKPASKFKDTLNG